MAKNNKKIVLGTAQLGMDYGFCKNKLYKSKKNIFKILDYAKKKNIRHLDTARSYNISEQNIGEYHNQRKSINKFKIITKLSYLSKIKKKDLKNKLLKDIFFSLYFLDKNKLDIVLIHNFKDVLKHKTVLFKYLNEIKKINLFNELGVSVYSPKEALICLKNKNIKHIQIPFNILDQRWLKTNFLKQLKSRPDVKIHARSIFLRGLILNRFKYWPIWLKNRAKIIENLEFLRKKFKMVNRLQLCLSYVKAFNWINFIIIGVDNLSQLKDIAKMKKKKNYQIYKKL